MNFYNKYRKNYYIVYLDETGINESLKRTYTWSKKCEKYYQYESSNINNISLLLAVSIEHGIIGLKFR